MGFFLYISSFLYIDFKICCPENIFRYNYKCHNFCFVLTIFKNNLFAYNFFKINHFQQNITFAHLNDNFISWYPQHCYFNMLNFLVCVILMMLQSTPCMLQLTLMHVITDPRIGSSVTPYLRIQLYLYIFRKQVTRNNTTIK